MATKLHLIHDIPVPQIVFGRALVLRLATYAEQLTGIPVGSLTRACRTHIVAHTRFAVMLVASERKRTTTVIGDALGGLDHTSVIYGITRARELSAKDEEYAELLAYLRWEAAR